MTIEPDTKDWTWVLQRPCDECGFDAATVHIAGRYSTVTGDQWERPGTRSNGSMFTVETIGKYHLHDVMHHLHDVPS